MIGTISFINSFEINISLFFPHLQKILIQTSLLANFVNGKQDFASFENIYYIYKNLSVDLLVGLPQDFLALWDSRQSGLAHIKHDSSY